jgi:hypothetical protein
MSTPRQSIEELTDAVNLVSARIARLEDAHERLVLMMAATVEEMRKVYAELLDASKPWWKR